MGNAPASSSLTATRSRPTSVSQELKSSTLSSSYAGAEPPRRFGTEGLRDLGFEYRCIPCCEQHDDSLIIKAVEKEEKEDNGNHQNTSSTSVTTTSFASSFTSSPRYRPDRICWRCQTALYHVTTGIRITSKNRPDFIPNGKRFEDVSAACQEVIQQECLLRDCSLSWTTISHPQDNDTTTTNRPPIRILWNRFTFDENNPTLIIITGKGLSRAGILSVRYILEQSIEVGSALFYITQALSFGYNVVLLDPNAWGPDYGKDTIEISLNAMFQTHMIPNTTNNIRILAHSAGGGYLVRYLLNHPGFQDQCRKIVFTDSTHNVQWAKHKHPPLYEYLQSPSVCLYVRNNSENMTDTFSKHKHCAAGEVCHGDRFWKQRFGDIPTVWAGTTDHSRMCYEARNIIWDFLRSEDGIAVDGDR